MPADEKTHLARRFAAVLLRVCFTRVGWEAPVRVGPSGTLRRVEDRGRDALEGSRLRRALERPYVRIRETCSSLSVAPRRLAAGANPPSVQFAERRSAAICGIGRCF